MSDKPKLYMLCRCESGYGWNVYADWIDILDPKPEREYEPVSADEIRVLLGGCAV